jgi:thymidylate synthase (FAD)
MKVTVLTHTVFPVQLATLAGKACHNSDVSKIADRFDSENYWDDKDQQEKDREFIRGIVARDEGSVIEHVSVTFLIEDISRVVSHELVRHRIASYSQLSMRHNSPEELHYIVPAEVFENEELKESWALLLKYASSLYRESRAAGVSWDSARYCLPMAIGTNVVMTMNLRSLRNFLKLRMHRSANPEMRELAKSIFDAVYEIMPDFVEDLKPLQEEE